MSDSEQDSEDFDDDVDDEAPRTMSPWQRLTGGGTLAGPARPTADFTGLSDEEIRGRIMGLDLKEKRVGIIAAIVLVVLGAYATVPYMVTKIREPFPTVPTAHKTCPHNLVYTTNSGASATCNGYAPFIAYLFTLIVFVLIAIAIFIGVRMAKRSLMAVPMMFGGLALLGLFTLPFLGAAIWLLIRAWRTQRYGTPTAKSPVPGYSGPPTKAARRRPSKYQESADQAERARNDARSPDSSSGRPQANKRYTPKTPPRKKPSA